MARLSDRLRALETASGESGKVGYATYELMHKLGVKRLNWTARRLSMGEFAALTPTEANEAIRVNQGLAQ